MIELLTIGEVLWDLFPQGKQLGGAPFNVAYHARQLGVRAGAISRVGADALGSEIVARARAHGLPEDLIQVDPVRPTGTVAVSLDAAGSPTFTITQGVAWDAIEVPRGIDTILGAARAVAFGTLAQRDGPSRDAIRTILERTPAPYKLYDINLRPPFWSEDIIRYSLQAATMVKLNDGELMVVRDLFALPPDDDDACRALGERFGLALVCVTKGAQGCAICEGGVVSHVPGRPVKVADTVGAGDAFSAGLLARLLEGAPAGEAARFANALGALVASRPGATPPVAREEIEA
jgi:fructokinase